MIMMFPPRFWQPRSARALDGLPYTKNVRKVRKTPTEIEVKLKVLDLSDILRKLHRLAGTSHGRVFERNTLYDTPDSAFWRSARLLRVRVESPAPGHGLRGGKAAAVLTAKGPAPARPAKEKPSRYKERAEREVPLKNPQAFVKTLSRLGLRTGFCYEKYRSRFAMPGLHLDLDETAVGIFLELEGRPAVIDHAAKTLGFVPKDYLRVSYWELYAADCHRKGVTARNMLLPRTKIR